MQEVPAIAKHFLYLIILLMRKSLLLLFFFFAMVSLSYGQRLTQFSTDTTKFTNDLTQFFMEFSANKDQAADYMKKFERLWKENKISGYYKELTMNTCNIMLTRRMKPYPFFVGYLNTIINTLENTRSGEAFDNWHECLLKMLAGKSNRGVQEFYAMSENIFTNNTFYKTPSYTYKTMEDNFKFIYDSIPMVIFENVTVVGLNPRGDSIAIEETSCVFYPTSGRLVGKNGRVSWARCGLDNEVFATIKRYNIDCKIGSYTSDSAVFTGKQFFDKPQLGKLTDRIITENNNITFPRFDSYSKRLLVKDIYPGVDYDGGFGMRGPTFVGSGNPARIIINKDDQKFMEISARAFGMSKDKIAANPGVLKLFLEKDTIYHPGISFTYQMDKKLVTIIRGDDGLQKTPFQNTFHKYDMYFEQILWNTEEPTMTFNFLPNNNQGEAYFESTDFFTREKAEAVRMGENINPIFKMIEYYNANNKPSNFSVVDFAKYLKYMAVDLRPIIFKMAIFGLVYFNPETDMISVRQRLFDYAENIKHKHDYDIITLHSVLPNRDNASMNLMNYDITLRGVKMVLLSDTQKVFMFPKDGEILLKKNRKMNFNGTVASGKFEFCGKDFMFDYDNFKINMNTIDSIRIFVESFEPDVNGNIPFRKVQTLIENVSGELRIDGPKNKSGWLKAPTFPSFRSFKESYAFYDKRKIYKGVYDRDKFYFKLDPFNIDSLDNFRNEALRFDGTFSSADIFPSFRETLTLQSDYSLGFIRQTPTGGFPIYGGKGNFDKTISLSNRGLRGAGDLNFSSSASKVGDLILFPDSANGIASTFDIKEGTDPEFPNVHGDSVRLHFMPYDEMLQAFDQRTQFVSYKEKVNFHGRYDLSYRELIGDGKVEFDKAFMISRNIKFERRKFNSDTANFKLKAFNEEGFTFSTVNVNAKIDFDKRIGEFITNGEGSFVKFDKCQYIAYMDRFKWYMDAEDIELGDTQKKMNTDANEVGLDLEGPEFISVHPKQDSLRFFAPGAKYNLRKYIISCKNVPYINVADARVTPNNGDVTIFKNAVMDTLKASKILANTTTQYHTIRNTTVNIFGRFDYLASGEYQYIDENDKPYLIRFQTIKPDTAGQTVSDGDIPEKDNFKFNDYFSFAGKVRLFAAQQFLTFDGGTKIVHNCPTIGKSYLRFTGEINPRDIQIPIPKKAIDMKGAAVGTGLFFALDSNMVYPAFISLQGGRSAKDLIEADGLLTYDKENKQYEISNKEKLEEMSLPGNYVSLSTETCGIYAEGAFNMSTDLGQVKLKTAGNAQYVPERDSAMFNLMMVCDFFFDNGLLKKMAKDFEIYLSSLNPTPFEGDLFNHGMIELLGKERGDRAISELNLYGNYKRFPDEFEKSLVFNEIHMVYNKRLKGYVSVGPVGLANIYKNEIFRYIPNAIIVIKKVKGNDQIDIYLEVDANTWYYFTYYRGVMLVASSNDEFNKSLNEMKAKNKKLNVEKGPAYRFDQTSKKKKEQFIDKLTQLGVIGNNEGSGDGDEPKEE